METYMHFFVYLGHNLLSKNLGSAVESIIHYIDGWRSRAVSLPEDQHVFLHVSQT
jgi:hypothetical protein